MQAKGTRDQKLRPEDELLQWTKKMKMYHWRMMSSQRGRIKRVELQRCKSSGGVRVALRRCKSGAPEAY